MCKSYSQLGQLRNLLSNTTHRLKQTQHCANHAGSDHTGYVCMQRHPCFETVPEIALSHSLDASACVQTCAVQLGPRGGILIFYASLSDSVSNQFLWHRSSQLPLCLNAAVQILYWVKLDSKDSCLSAQTWFKLAAIVAVTMFLLWIPNRCHSLNTFPEALQVLLQWSLS